MASDSGRGLGGLRGALSLRELLGDAARAAGRLEEAADRYREAMTLLEALNYDSKETEVATKLADIYLTLDDRAAAGPLVGLVSQRPPTLAVYRPRARHAAVRGDEAAAAELMRSARELGDERWSDEDEALLAGYRAAL